MNVHHHLSDETLLEYASGAMSEGWSLAVATHLALCPDCRSKLETLEAAGGALMKDIECVATDEDQSWKAMRARLIEDKMSGTDSVADTTPRSDARIPPINGVPILPEPLRSYVGADAPDLKWKSLGNARHLPISTGDPSTMVRLLRIPAGKPVPEHGHRGREFTLVLSGSFRDDVDRFARGDIEEADEDLQHQPIADEGEDCICLVVTDAPIRFRSWLLRLAQPMLGI